MAQSGIPKGQWPFGGVQGDGGKRVPSGDGRKRVPSGHNAEGISDLKSSTETSTDHGSGLYND